MKPRRTPATTMTYKLPGHGPDHDLPITRVQQGEVTSEWSLSIAERMAIARGGRVELAIFTEPIPPVSLVVVERKRVEALFTDDHPDASVSEMVDDDGPHDTRLTPHDLGKLAEPFGCIVVTKAYAAERAKELVAARDLKRAGRFWMGVAILLALGILVHWLAA